jgi:RND family efflux transporter MFP subunit
MKRLRLAWLPQLAGAAAAALIVLLAMAWLAGVFRRDVIEPRRLPLRATTAAASVGLTPSRRVETVDLIGTVQSETRSQVSPRIRANIISISVDTGSEVKEGELIASLDDRDLRARLEQAKELLRAAETRRDRAKRRADRLQPLVRDLAASADELDDWTAQYTNALAEVAQFQQQLREAEVALSDARILSPISGVVVERLADPGDMTTPGKAIVVVYDPRKLRLEALAREAYVGRLESMRRSGETLSVLVDSVRREIPGAISQIVPSADPGSRSFLVKVVLKDSAGLYPGMFGRLRLPLDEVEVLEVPLAVVRRVGQTASVAVALPDRIETRAVRLGRTRGDRVEILAGLSAGDRIANVEAP